MYGNANSNASPCLLVLRTPSRTPIIPTITSPSLRRSLKYSNPPSTPNPNFLFHSLLLSLLDICELGRVCARQLELALSIEEIPPMRLCTMPLSKRTRERVLGPGRGCPLGMQWEKLEIFEIKRLRDSDGMRGMRDSRQCVWVE